MLSEFNLVTLLSSEFPVIISPIVIPLPKNPFVGFDGSSVTDIWLPSLENSIIFALSLLE